MISTVPLPYSNYFSVLLPGLNENFYLTGMPFAIIAGPDLGNGIEVDLRFSFFAFVFIFILSKDDDLIKCLMDGPSTFLFVDTEDAGSS